MTIMNQEKESSRNTTKKICPRAVRENAKKNAAEVNSKKITAHSGLKFHFDEKKIITHEFSFQSVSKNEKVTRCRSREKSVEKQNGTESNTNTESKDIKVLMDTLKISKSEECKTREKSLTRKETPKTPISETLTSKKVCTRCTRCSRAPKEEKPEVKPPKITKNQNEIPKTTKKETNSVKTVRIETLQSPKMCKKQCSKLAKLLAQPEEKTVKPKSILVHAEKPVTPREDEKKCTSKNCDGDSSNTEKEKSCSANKKKSNCPNEGKPEFWPKSGIPERVTPRSETPEANRDKAKSEIANETSSGTGHSDGPETKACLLNGTGHDKEPYCDPHLLPESSNEVKKESVKTTSKIPLKSNGGTGLKLPGMINEGGIPQAFNLDNGSEIMKHQLADVML